VHVCCCAYMYGNTCANAHTQIITTAWSKHKRQHELTNVTTTSHKRHTNVNKRHTNVTQTSHKCHTNVTQMSHKRHTNVTQTSHKRHTNVNKRHTNVPQMSHKRHTNVTQTSQKRHTNATHTQNLTHCKTEIPVVSVCPPAGQNSAPTPAHAQRLRESNSASLRHRRVASARLPSPYV
jgi:hypothetical protein